MAQNNKRLEQQVEEISKLAKENKNIDAAALMLNALQTEEKNSVSPRTKKWLYIISVGAPPLGLLFALKYYFSSEDDARQVANMCVLLTGIALLALFMFGKVLFNSAGVTPQQIEQIKPSDIYQLKQ